MFGDKKKIIEAGKHSDKKPKKQTNDNKKANKPDEKPEAKSKWL